MSYLERGPWIPREQEMLRRGEMLPTNAVPLAFACLCQDCECVWDVRRAVCPNCSSATFMPIASWLFSTKEATP